VNSNVGFVCAIQRVNVVLKSGDTKRLVMRETDCFETRNGERNRAIRAVANACAANAIALAIPRHRVARSDGAPGGCRLGMERKQFLIEKEAGVRTRNVSLAPRL
jgi:O-6-methylguanine DNA methyltransferase